MLYWDKYYIGVNRSVENHYTNVHLDINTQSYFSKDRDRLCCSLLSSSLSSATHIHPDPPDWAEHRAAVRRKISLRSKAELFTFLVQHIKIGGGGLLFNDFLV